MLKSFAVLLAAVFLSACSDPLAPISVIGEFRADDRIGREEDVLGARVKLLDAKVLVYAGGLERSWVLERTSSGVTDTLRFVQAMAYTIDGRRLVTRKPECRGRVCDLSLPTTPDYLLMDDLLIELDGEGKASVAYQRFWAPFED